jgi:hypothetical protein
VILGYVDETTPRRLARAGNWAVVRLPGRAFPGINVQGDTFAALVRSLAEAAQRVRSEPTNPAALDDLDASVDELNAILAYYERVRAEHGMRRPY